MKREIAEFLGWLQTSGIGAADGYNTFLLHEEACHAVLSSCYPSYQQALQRLQSFTEEQFVWAHHDLENALIDLKFSLADPSGYWIALENHEAIPFAWFLRIAEKNQPYTIHSVVYQYD